MNISVSYLSDKAQNTLIASIGSTLFSDLNSDLIATYWDGQRCANGREFRSSLTWSDTALAVLFSAKRSEPPVVANDPVTDTKTIGLWERDVCEIFIAPDRDEPRKYFEFEIAPTGEWLDVAIDLTSGERVPDWDYHSGMQTTARIEEGRVLMAMRIPWEAFGKKPEAGDVWLGNVFRCIGEGENRGYLAWRPTMTAKPNFHVPEAFGEFHFLK